jgi:hypothetical protein
MASAFFHFFLFKRKQSTCRPCVKHDLPTWSFSNPIKINSSSYSLAYGPYSLNSAAFRMRAHANLSSALFLLSTPIDFRSFSIQYNHLNLLAFRILSGFPRNTFFTILSSEILTRCPANSSLLTL